MDLLNLFSLTAGEQSRLMTGQHHHALMLLSILVAIISAICALQVASLVRVAQTAGMRRIALGSGSLVLAGGIWAMHFIGMLAYDPGVPVTFDPFITALSVLPALLASWLALELLGANQNGPTGKLIGGTLIGIGIGTMHYTGMAAMEVPAEIRLDPIRFLLSLVVAVTLSIFALWVHFRLRRHVRLREVYTTMLAGLVMGLAISAMHYTGMSAALFIAPVEAAAGQMTQFTNERTILALSISTGMLILGLVVVGSNAFLRYHSLLRRLRNNEDSLRSSEARYRSLISNIPGTSFRCLPSQNWPVLFISSAVTDLTGYPPEDFTEGRRHFSDVMHPEDRQQVFDQIMEHLHHREQYESRYRVIHRNGEERWVSERASAIYDEAGNALWIDGVIIDITQQYRIMQALEQARDQAEAAAEAKSAFLANMSHEIRTPMNAILGFTEVLLETSLDESQYRQLKTVNRSARSLLRLLDDILDTAKLDQGALILESQPFSMRQLGRELIDVCRLEAERKGLDLSMHYTLAHDWYQGDPLRVHQVLLNLLSNAVKFTLEGSVTLEIGAQNGGILMKVIDTGPGIDTERLEQIFEPFTQADASMSRRFGGTGLGTTIARQLSGLMGGRLSAESHPGVGSTFTVWLPLSMTTERHSVPRTEESTLPVLRILAVDDVEENLELIQQFLSGSGHTLIRARSGQEAFECWSDSQIDVILMDVHMPDVDGHTATRKIREHEQLTTTGNRPERTPIIALTASVMEQDRREAYEAGMDGFVQKPLDRHQMLAEIAYVLGSRPVEVAPSSSPASDRDAIQDILSAQERWGDAALLADVTERFVRRLPVDMQDLESALAALDREALIAGLHRMKGSAANLSLNPLSEAAGALEHRLRSSGTPLTHELLAPLRDAARRTLQGLAPAP